MTRKLRLPTHPSLTAILRPIAHRGLHDAAHGVIENSLPAFDAAVSRGYGIECDLRPARHGVPVVFHDTDLDRLTALSGPIAARSVDELQRLPLTGGHGATIPPFGQLLERVSDRVPLVVEVKSEWGPVEPAFIAAIAALANAYTGPIVLMSFDPAVVQALAVAAPGVPRGLVSGSYLAPDGSNWWPDALTDARRSHLRDLADFEAVGASFAAYEAAALPTPRTAALRLAGIPILAWTVRTRQAWATAQTHADAAIFEGAVPPSETLAPT